MKNLPHQHCRPRLLTQFGLSLVELMVGLTIGLMLTLGLFTLIAGQSTTFKMQDDFARMQENATAALRHIGDSVRMAGFYGYGLDSTAINITIGGVNTTTDCGSATYAPAVNWALQVQTPVFGMIGETPLTVNANVPCILQANFAAAPNPILVTRSAAGFRIPDPNADGNLTDGLAAQPNYLATIYLQSDPNAGLIFYGNNFAALKGAGSTRATVTGADFDIFEYRAHVYYIRPCSRAAGGVACAATDDGGRPIPTLARQELVGSAMTEVALVEGVERIDYRFGVDSNNDCVPDTFTATPAANDWANVVAVKVAVLVRSPTLSSQYDDSGKTYDLDGDGNVDYRCTDFAAPACNFKRKVFSQTFQVRNVAQRRGC